MKALQLRIGRISDCGIAVRQQTIDFTEETNIRANVQPGKFQALKRERGPPGSQRY
jgi:hypothetical protein